MTHTDPFIQHTLPNGLRVVIEPMPGVTGAAAGFLVRTGARDEPPALAGVSHFVEHMCFKGTARRTWEQITIDFDEMGSTYNAYTSKEQTVYHGWVPAGRIGPQIELLADMMRSAMPSGEFDMEKKVILEEIAMSDDSLERQVFEALHAQLFAGHALAWPVLGTTESITALTRDQLYGYFEERYHPANMVLIAAGAIDPREIIAAAEAHCGGWPARPPRPARQAPAAFKPGTGVQHIDRFQQQAVTLLYPAPPAGHDDRVTAEIFASILGGHNSRIYWNVVQTGVAPHVSAGCIDYCDNGLLYVVGFCEPGKAEELLAAMKREIAAIAAEGVDEDEVLRVRNRVRTGLATESEAPYYRLNQLVEDIDVFGRPRGLAERLGEVEAVTAGRIHDYLRRWPMGENAFLTSIGPRNWPAPAQIP